ncbi:outer membrane beta-barrel protein [Vibrio hepatarius]|uniref:outer membrane beta-barrel protein n=1 Tax=Vibrio hepatarius TaxID=171383 RepID=UPI001C093493|nr:outer membrane beta-barrel protein [Vibrio hepatarius]MBU2898483.1 porin family protein [Vibrio hepatarius]
MKKALLIAAIAATASMPSLANDTYFALELGAGQYDYSGKSSDTKEAKEINDMGVLALKVGHYLNQNVRAYGYLQLSASDEYNHIDVTTREMGAGADYLHFVNDKFYLLAGGNLGYQKTVVEDDSAIDSYKFDNTGVVAGANLGLGYKFTDNFGMELGYRHSHYFSNEIKEVELKVDATDVVYLNANFAF